MAHTNIDIHYDVEGDYWLRRVKELEFQAEYWKKIANQHHGDLKNIPDALAEYDHVDFYDDKGNLIITAIAKRQQEEA